MKRLPLGIAQENACGNLPLGLTIKCRDLGETAGRNPTIIKITRLGNVGFPLRFNQATLAGQRFSL
ncbi:hypothetical protein [Vandammella animalimorsus]|uniref:hypothetical protein n=1 Tax=Vandammella animalimorsus TaxID=2029117 RepID=UPI001177EBE7|nr:hypothetical protein [Vandammella animalimorsus]